MAIEKTQGAGNHADLARRSAVHDCVPNDFDDHPVTADVAQSISLTPYSGKRIWLKAIDGDITVLRGVHDEMTVDEGIVVDTADNPLKNFWVDPGDGVVNSLAVRAGGATTLRIFFCSDL